MFLQALISLIAFSSTVSAPSMTSFSHHNEVNTAIMQHNEVRFDDYSHADVDGPFVFYRNGKVLVKSVTMRDSVAVPVVQHFHNKEEVGLLTCIVPETRDTFSFHLRENLPIQSEVYDLPSKILAISDIEGNFKGFKMLLQGVGVMDGKFNWTFGNGHLVLDGDFFDRGLNVTEVLWLLYKLEPEAEAAGGKIHFILGNHEILNLEGNTQYVRNKYLENVGLIGEPYRKWYADDTELGRWLRTKNAIERIGDFAFCHGGISMDLATSGIKFEKINDIVRKNLGIPNDQIMDRESKLVFDTKLGIFWYRGISKKKAEKGEVSAALDWAGAKRLVVGHTLVEDLTALYSGRVFCIDLFHDENLRNGFMKSLWIEDGTCFGIDNKGVKSATFGISNSK